MIQARDGQPATGSPNFFSYNNENNHKKGKDRQKNAKPGCKGHRGFGKIDNSIDRIFE